jgi:tRNA (guanine10-N2)-methyltransferase
MESFAYLEFEGPIRMKGAAHELCMFEYFDLGGSVPKMLYFAELLAPGARNVIGKYDLKKRKYISTTSMDAELALLTANIALAAPGKSFFDPFMGTGSFPIACAHFGAICMGSDIDGRSIRGKEKRNFQTNLTQYSLQSQWLDSFVSDLTNTPLRRVRWLDGIVCDPPYGIREGCRVLGPKSGKTPDIFYRDGVPSHL